MSKTPEFVKETKAAHRMAQRSTCLTSHQIVSLGVFSQYSGSTIFSNYSNLIYEGAGITGQNQRAPMSSPILLTYASLWLIFPPAQRR